MGDYYQNAYGRWPADDPNGPPQGRLPPIDHDAGGGGDIALTKMNKIGVDNPTFNDPEANGFQDKSRENGMNGKPGRDAEMGHKNDPHSSPDAHGHEKKKPLKFCSFIVNHHKLAFGITLGGQIFFFVMTGVLIAAGYDIFPVEFEGVPLYINDDDTYLRWLAWENRDESSVINKANTSAFYVGERTDTDDILQLFYESGSNVLTKERLTAIKATENDFTSVPQWKDYCYAKSKDDPSCAEPTSITYYFKDVDPTFDNIPQTLYNAMKDPEANRTIQGLLGHGYTITDQVAEAYLTRTLFFFGVPLPGYDLTTDSIDDQREDIRDFQVDYWRDKCKDLNSDGLSGMDVYYMANEMRLYDTFNQVIGDLLLAVGSMFFIYIFMLFQTSSVWLTSFAIMSIFGSFLGCNLIYRIVLDYKYFGIFHVLSVFIILGIGADDIFVFNDTWEATYHEGHSSLEDRLSEAYRRASMSMLITTTTTFVAFVSNAVSPLLGISGFGIFSAILVFVNYLSAVIFFPCVVIMYHRHFEDFHWPCCIPIDKGIDFIKSKICRKDSDSEEEEQPNIIVRFFDGPYATVVTHKIFRWVFIAVSMGLVAMFLYFASTLEVAEESMQFFRDGHNYQEASDLNSDGFAENLDDNNVEVYIMFGLENQDRDDCHKTDFECKGTSVWDEAFDLNPKPAQIQLLKLCEFIKTEAPTENPELELRTLPDGTTEMECFITAMDVYMTNESHYGRTADTNTTYYNFSIPVSELRYQEFFNDHPDLYDQDFIYGESFYRFFETVKNYWIRNGYDGNTTEDYRIYSVKLGESDDVYDTREINGSNPDGFKYGTRMRYAGIMMKTKLTPGTRTYEDGLDWKDHWSDFVANKMKDMPPSVAGGVPMTPGNDFHDFKVKEVLARSAQTGVVMGLCLAFVVLTVATTNIILSFMATISIGCVTVTIIGIMPMLGWKLSVIESVNLTLVVGLAVDYVVHLSESYNHSPSMDRNVRVRHMLKSMGISVISGACSTCGASVFMMFAVLQFFFQFGIFVFCTIAFSLFYSLCLFPPVLSLIGPVGTTGSLKPLVRRLVYKIKGRHMDDPDCEPCKGKGFIKLHENTDL